MVTAKMLYTDGKERDCYYDYLWEGAEEKTWYYLRDNGQKIPVLIITRLIIANGVPQKALFIEREGGGVWVYEYDQTKEITYAQRMQITLENLMDELLCQRKDISNSSQSARKHSIAVTQLEIALNTIRSLEYDEHSCYPAKK